MILVEVGELIVEENGRLEGRWNVKFHDAFALLCDVGDGCVARVVEMGVTRGIRGRFAVCCTHVVGVFVGGYGGESQAIGRSCCGEILAFGVVEGHFSDARGTPDEKATNRCEYNANEEKSRQNCLWSENGLPCLETLLLERSIWVDVSG